MAVEYEWTLEDVDENDDVVESHQFESRKEMIEFAGSNDPTDHWDFCLVRNQGNQAEGLKDRQWAYFDRGEVVPEKFDGGAVVPAKYRNYNV